MIIGAALAALAGLIYDAGVGLQAIEAREIPETHAWSAGLLTRLVRRPVWVFGTALGLVGWPVHAVALLFAPLAVVQPALAVGLVALLAVGGRSLGENVTRRDVTAVSLIAASVVGISAFAPDPTLRPRGDVIVLSVLAGLALVIGLLWIAVQRRPDVRRAAPVLAGLCFAWSGLSTQLVADAAHRGAWGAAVIWTVATACASGLGLLAEMTALQQLPATRVAPAVFVAQVVGPVALGPFVTAGPLLTRGALGLAVTVGCVVAILGAATLLLSRSGAVGAVLDDDDLVKSRPSGSDVTPPPEPRPTNARNP